MVVSLTITHVSHFYLLSFILDDSLTELHIYEVMHCFSKDCNQVSPFLYIALETANLFPLISWYFVIAVTFVVSYYYLGGYIQLAQGQLRLYLIVLLVAIFTTPTNAHEGHVVLGIKPLASHNLDIFSAIWAHPYSSHLMYLSER